MALELVNKLPYDHPYRWDGTLFGGPKLWRPDELGLSLALWLDAEDASTITLNGSTVSQWDDKSGNGRHAVQATAANQPTYTVSGIGQKGSLTIPVAPRWLTYTDNNTVTSATIATVGEIVDTTGTSRVAGLVTTSTTSDPRKTFAQASDGSLRFDGAFLEGPALPTNPLVRVSTRTPTNLFDWRNGTLSAQGVAPSDSMSRNFVVGNAIAFDSFAAGTFTGKVGEVVVTYSELSTSDRQKLEGYLAWKWGTVAGLPTNHPYKLNPPIL